MDAVALDRMMRDWAEAQHGLVGRDQLAAAKVDARAVRRRLASPAWECATPRVLRLVGAARTGEQRAMAAILDCGRGTVASHGTAAALWGMPGFDLRRIHVSRLRTGSDRTTQLAALHHPRMLSLHHVSRRSAIPVTTLARTVVDLGGALHPARVEVVVHAAVRLGLPWSTLAETVDELRSRGRPGVGVVRGLVEEHGSDRPMESGLEVRFLQLLRAAGLPEPRRQVDLGGAEWAGRVDFVYDDVHLIMEINSRRYHDGPLERRRDDRRTAALVAAGFRVLPIPEDLIRRAPNEVIRLVTLARRATA